MSCDSNDKKVCEKFELAKNDMVLAGFDPSYIADLIAQYGDSVVTLISDAIRHGFSKQFVVDTLVKFGPAVLKFLLSWFVKSQEKAMVFGAEPGAVVDETVLDATLIETFLQRMLPKLLEKYGEQLLDALVGMIVKYLTK